MAHSERVKKIILCFKHICFYLTVVLNYSCGVLKWAGVLCGVLTWAGVLCGVLTWAGVLCGLLTWAEVLCGVLTWAGVLCGVLTWAGGAVVVDGESSNGVKSRWTMEAEHGVWKGRICTRQLLTNKHCSLLPVV